jgi:hypothetical protein
MNNGYSVNTPEYVASRKDSGKRVGAPSKRADNMTEVLHRRERWIERCTPHRVDDEVEAHSLGAGFDGLLDGLRAEVYRRSAKACDDVLIAVTPLAHTIAPVVPRYDPPRLAPPCTSTVYPACKCA